MSGSFEIDDVLGGAAPPWKVLVLRGLFRRCPRCGGDHVFAGRYQLKERCDTCGYRFRREPGFALGAWFINFMVLQFLLLAEAMVFIVWKSNRPDAALTIPLSLGVATTIAIPLLLYPFAQTIWAGIDLAMTPLELDEIVEAADYVAGEPTDIVDRPADPSDPGEPDPSGDDDRSPP